MSERKTVVSEAGAYAPEGPHDILEYYVFTTRDGGLWLHADEKHWTPNFRTAAAFSTGKLANEIGTLANGFDDAIYVFALLGSE